MKDEEQNIPPSFLERDDSQFIKPQPLVSTLLLIKLTTSFPFYITGLYAPEYLDDYSWILYNEAFHHYHARIFYLLALYRCMSQLYFSVWGNGLVQRRFVMLECIFDSGVVLLYAHEYYRLHNIKVLISNYSMIHLVYIFISLICLSKTNSTKLVHPV